MPSVTTIINRMKVLMKKMKITVTVLLIVFASGCVNYKQPTHNGVAYLLFFGGSTEYSIANITDMKWKNLNSSYLDSFTLGVKYISVKIDSSDYQTLKASYHTDSGVMSNSCKNELEFAFKPQKDAVYFAYMLTTNTCKLEVYRTGWTPLEMEKVIQEKGKIDDSTNILESENEELIKMPGNL